MKKFLLLVSLGLNGLFYAQESSTKEYSPPPGNASAGDSYGAGVSQKAEHTAISPRKLEKKLKKSGTIDHVAVKGTVTDVCDKKECWITLQTEDNERFFVKMKDYAFFVPTALKGKKVVLEGKAESREISVDELKHYAEDAKKSPEEIEKISQPENEIRFLASGIKVVE